MIIVIAQKEELKLVEELGYTCPVIITGVGGVNVINALKHLPKDTEILNIGYCGSNKLDIGTKVSPSCVYTLHEKAKFKEYTGNCRIAKNHDWCVPCYTSTDFVTKSKIKDVCIFDMELAFICSLFDNVWAIKVVSDNLNKKQYEENVNDRKS